MNFEKIDGNKVKVCYDVTAEEFSEALDYAFGEAQKKVNVPGFRKGHVPRNVFEQRFGVEALFEDALNYVINHRYDELFSTDEFVIVGRPEVDLDWSTLAKDKGFSFNIIAPVKPEVTLGQYKGLTATKDSAIVTDDEVEEEVKRLFKDQMETTVKENGVLENGDTAILDYKGLKDGVAFDGGTAENADLVIGNHTFIPGFEEQMIGMAPGEERDLNLTFPENYGHKDLAGANVVFQVKLHEIKVTKLPELTDDMVAGLNREDCKTVAELRPALVKQLTDRKVEAADNKLEEELIQQAVKNASFTPSKEMIQTEKKNLIDRLEQQYKMYGFDIDSFLTYTGTTRETFEAQQEAEAERRVSNHLVIDAIVKAEGFTATEEEVEAKYNEYALTYKMPVEDVKKHLSHEDIEYEVCFRKAIDLIVSTADVK